MSYLFHLRPSSLPPYPTISVLHALFPLGIMFYHCSLFNSHNLETTYIDSHILLFIHNNWVERGSLLWFLLVFAEHESPHVKHCSPAHTLFKVQLTFNKSLKVKGCRTWRHKISEDLPLIRIIGLHSLLVFVTRPWGMSLSHVVTEWCAVMGPVCSGCEGVKTSKLWAPINTFSL